jgi:hypothetical protein
MSWGKGGGVELIEVFDAETAKKRRIRLTICTASNYAEQYEISGLVMLQNRPAKTGLL